MKKIADALTDSSVLIIDQRDNSRYVLEMTSWTAE